MAIADIDLRLNQLSKIICSSLSGTAEIAAASAEHRSLCKSLVTLPPGYGKGNNTGQDRLELVYETIIDLYKETGEPVTISDITDVTGLTRQHAGIAVGQLSQADKVRTTHDHTPRRPLLLVTPL